LQTSRTVTFIIQKNKKEIENFGSWYDLNVIKPWANDVVMTWAKDARNVIEKEGDLDLNSKLSPSVIYSHISQNDFQIEVDRPLLLSADVSLIAKKVKAKLSSGVADAAVLCIQRRWVANTLPEHELIWALTYVYASLYKVCKDLALHIGEELDSSIPSPTRLDPNVNDVFKTRYIKLGKPHVHSLQFTTIPKDENFLPPQALLDLRDDLNNTLPPQSFDDVVNRMARIAEYTFIQYGNHVPMTFLYDENWNIIDQITVDFADQSEKFLYARHVASRAGYLKAFAVISISETWLRNFECFPTLPIRKLPIVGEQLLVFGGVLDGSSKIVTWNIVRSDEKAAPRLERVDVDMENDKMQTFFIQPIIEAMQVARRPK
jgi:hypothetical protein